MDDNNLNSDTWMATILLTTLYQIGVGTEMLQIKYCTAFTYKKLTLASPPPTNIPILGLFTEWKIFFSNSLWTIYKGCCWFWTSIKMYGHHTR